MRKLRIFVVLLLLSGNSFIFAQEENSTPTKTEEDTKKPDREYTNALGVNFGLTGFGIDYGRKLNDHFSARFRYLNLPVSIREYEYEISGQDLLVDVDVNSSQFGLVADYYPWKNHSFKLMAGFSYFTANYINTLLKFTDTLYFGDPDPLSNQQGSFAFTPNDLGQLGIDLNWNQLSPYLGLGFGRVVPKRKVGFAVEVGAFYIGSPNVNIEASGMIEDTKEEEEQLQENLSDLQWLPQVNFRLSFRL